MLRSALGGNDILSSISELDQVKASAIGPAEADKIQDDILAPLKAMSANEHHGERRQSRCPTRMLRNEGKEWAYPGSVLITARVWDDKKRCCTGEKDVLSGT